MPVKSPGRSSRGLGTLARDEGAWDLSPGIVGWADACKGRMNTEQGRRKEGSWGSPHLHLLRPAHLVLPLNSAPDTNRESHDHPSSCFQPY